MKNKRVVAYCRVSTEQESQEQSFKSQQEHYKQLFEKEGHIGGNCGAMYTDKLLQVTSNGIYADEGISGAKAYTNRQAFMQMIEDAKLGLYDKIYCKNIYRFSRDVEAGAKFIKDLRELNVEVYFEDMALSTLDAKSDMYINLSLAIGQEESRAKSAAVQWGIRKQQEQGKYHSAVTPYGYEYDDDRYLKINEEEAEVVKLIFKLYYDKGYGTQKIARTLNAKNIPTKLGKKWANKQIHTIIRNELYKGVQITNKFNVDATARYTDKETKKEDRIIHEFEHLKIIDEQIFNKVQEEIEKRSKQYKEKGYNRHSTTHLLSNLIKCGNCGSGFTRKKRKAYTRIDGTNKELGYEWVCSINDKYGKDRCGYRNQILEDELIERIQENISIFQNNTELFNELKEKYLFTYHNAEDRVKEKQKCDEELQKLNKQVELNFELLSDNIIDKLEYQNRNNNLQRKIKDINTKLAKVQSVEQEIKKVEKDFEYHKKLFQNTDINNLTNAGLKKLIDNIIVTTVKNKKNETIGKISFINWKFLKSTDTNITLDTIKKLKAELKGNIFYDVLVKSTPI
ncbi:MAG: recombinase family protein [Firmicutes bacterium]|nr:recombinase family protein [Bacillota bacterium]